MPVDLSAFSLTGSSAVLIGGGGVLGSAIARGLGQAGARVAVCDLAEDKASAVVADLEGDEVDARPYRVDAMDKGSIAMACEQILRDFGQVDVLVNLAGGNLAEASTSAERAFFDLPLDALEKAVALNLFGGAVLPAQVFGKAMAENPEGGSIINTASMNALRPLTRIPAYSAGKAAVANFTQWLAVHMAREYNPKLRVNALAALCLS